MTAEARCPNTECRYTLRVSTQNLGKKMKCKLCGTPFTLSPSATSPERQVTQAGSRSTVPTSSSSAQPAKKLGRFEIRSHLGSGAFGAVYRAHDPQLDREVALKVPHAAKLRNRWFVKRFLNEAKATARLQHPHIVPLFDAGKNEKRYYLASAFIEGGTLDKAIGERTFEFRETARIIMQLAEALAYAHKQGIVHRDVKPDNIMLDLNGEPHLMDFGLARLETSDEKLTQDGTVMGTPAYMSPEQARGVADDISPASDQYSLGATMYEMLTGEIPFSGLPEVVIFHVIQTEPAAPRSIKSSVPIDLETICLKAMSKHPAARYESCQQMAEDLRRWLDNEPIAARKISRFERLLRWVKREPIVSGLALTVFLMFAVGLAVSSWQWSVANKQTERALKASEKEMHAREAETKVRQQLAGSLKSERAALKRARSGLYGFQFHEVQKACLDSQHETALKILQQLADDPEYAHLRSWEWRLMNGAMTYPEPLQVIDDSDVSVPSTADMGTRAISWSHDGSIIALPRRLSGGLNLYDVKSGKLTKKLDTPVRAFSWSTRQPELAIMRTTEVEFHGESSDANSQSSVNVSLPEFRRPKLRSVAKLVWNPQGTQIAAIRRIAEYRQGEYSGHIAIIDRDLQQVAWSQSWDDRSPAGVCWSPDGTQIAVGFHLKSDRSGEENVALLNASDGTIVRTIDPKESRPDYMQWSPDGDLIYFGSKGGGSGHLYSTKRNKLQWATMHTHAPRFAFNAVILGQPGYRHLGIFNFQHHSRRALLWGCRTQGLAWGPNAQQVVIGIPDGGRGPQGAHRFEIYDISKIPTPYVEFMNRGPHTSSFSDLAWSPDGELLSTVTADGSIWLLDADGSTVIKKTEPLGAARYQLRWLDHPSRVVVADSNGNVRFIEVPNLKETKSIDLSNNFKHLEWNSAEDRLCISHEAAGLVTLNVKSLNEVPNAVSATNRIEAFATRSEAPGCYVLDSMGNVSLVKDTSKSQKTVLGMVEPGASSMSCDRAGRRLIFSYSHGSCAMYAKRDNGLKLEWTIPSAGIDAKFHPTDDRIAILRGNGDVTIANASTGAVLLDLSEDLYSPHHRSRSEFQPTRLEWSPDGGSLAVAGYCRGWSGASYGVVGIWRAVNYTAR